MRWNIWTTYFNCNNAKFFSQLWTFPHNCGSKFENGIFVAPSVCTTSFVHFPFIKHFKTINLDEIISKLSVIRKRGCFSVANSFICSSCAIGKRKYKQLIRKANERKLWKRCHQHQPFSSNLLATMPSCSKLREFKLCNIILIIFSISVQKQIHFKKHWDTQLCNVKLNCFTSGPGPTW